MPADQVFSVVFLLSVQEFINEISQRRQRNANVCDRDKVYRGGKRKKSSYLILSDRKWQALKTIRGTERKKNLPLFTRKSEIKLVFFNGMSISSFSLLCIDTSGDSFPINPQGQRVTVIHGTPKKHRESSLISRSPCYLKPVFKYTTKMWMCLSAFEKQCGLTGRRKSNSITLFYIKNLYMSIDFFLFSLDNTQVLVFFLLVFQALTRQYATHYLIEQQQQV